MADGSLDPQATRRADRFEFVIGSIPHPIRMSERDNEAARARDMDDPHLRNTRSPDGSDACCSASVRDRSRSVWQGARPGHQQSSERGSPSARSRWRLVRRWRARWCHLSRSARTRHSDEWHDQCASGRSGIDRKGMARARKTIT